jgi:mono/diheme cytochrome c family protein
MEKVVSSAVVVVFASLLVVGTACTGANEEAPPSAGTVPATNAAPAGGSEQLVGSAEDRELARAAALFETNCSECHLASGTGDPHHRKDKIPNFTDAAWQKRESDAALIKAVTTGHGKVMPAFKDKLSQEEIALLVRYVRGFPERAGAAGPAPKGAPKPQGGGHGGH